MEKIPFIFFLYVDEACVRKVYKCDWPEQFIRDFSGKTITAIGGFYVLGVLQNVNSIEDAFKICKG